MRGVAKFTSILAAATLLAVSPIASSPAGAVELPMIDDFEAALVSGSTGTVPLGFLQATDPKSVLSYQRVTTLPEPRPGSAEGNAALRVDTTVDAWAVVVHAFTNEAVTQWVNQDWSSAEGFQFWLHGNGSGTNLFVDLIDNRPDGSSVDDAERYTASFTDSTAGWRLVQIPFDSMTRKDIGNGAPNDGLGLTEVHGWAFGSLATVGEKTFFLDDVSLYGVAPVRPLTVGFATVDTQVSEGATAQVPLKLSKVSDQPVSVTVRSTVFTARKGVDFDPVNVTVTIPAGSTTATVPVPTVDDDSYLGERAVVLEISEASGADRGRPPVTRVLITDDETRDPNLIDAFETEPYLWSATGRTELSSRKISDSDRLARPGQTGTEGVLSAKGGSPYQNISRRFPIEQDWSASEALTFWYYGRKTGKRVEVALTNPTRSVTEGDPETWPLLWSDEFNTRAGTAPDSRWWRHEEGDGAIIGKPGWGNDELQYYTSNVSNAATDGRGHLVLTTRKTSGDSGPLCYYGPCQYTSARLLTQDRAEFAYGRLEARVQVPEGAGLWPAFWSLGTNITTHPWPASGEIDVMEYVGREPQRIFGTIHGPGYSGGQSFGDDYVFPNKVADGFHTYRVDWYPDHIVWAVDGIEYHEAVPANVSPNEWVFNHPFFLLLNVAVGGNFGGTVSPDTVFPAKTKVDYVRAYQADRQPTRHTASFVDNSIGWRQVRIPFSAFGASLDRSKVLSLTFRAPVRPNTPTLIDQVGLACGQATQVTSIADGGPGSLRQAVASVCPGGTVTLDASLSGETVRLASPLTVNGSVTIDGTSAPGVTLSAGGQSRVIEVAKGATVTIRGLTLTQGYGWELAGGVLNNGDLTLEKVTVAGNTVATGGIDFWKGGGGIYSGEGARLHLIDSSVANNTVTGGAGGGVYSYFGTTTIVERSTISGNRANDVGGGLRLLGNAEMTNSTISGNTSTGWHGGGVFQTDGTLTMTHTTITGNTAPDGTSGGLFVGTFGASGATIDYSSSVVAGNTGEQCFLAPFGSGAVALVSRGGSVVGDATCAPLAADLVAADAKLGPLADNGGPTWTHLPTVGSAAIDQATASSLTNDQRGLPRPVGPAPDAGSVEVR